MQPEGEVLLISSSHSICGLHSPLKIRCTKLPVAKRGWGEVDLHNLFASRPPTTAYKLDFHEQVQGLHHVGNNH